MYSLPIVLLKFCHFWDFILIHFWVGLDFKLFYWGPDEDCLLGFLVLWSWPCLVFVGPFGELWLGLSRQNLGAFVLNSLLAWDSSGAGSGDPVSVFSACTWLAFSIGCAHVILSFFSKFKYFQQVWRTSMPPSWDPAVLGYLWVQAWLCRGESRGLWIFLPVFWMLFTLQGLELLHPVPSVSQSSPCSVIVYGSPFPLILSDLPPVTSFSRVCVYRCLFCALLVQFCGFLSAVLSVPFRQLCQSF